MFSYNISTSADENAFFSTCDTIENAFPKLEKEELLVDVDGSQIQTYTENSWKITVFNDYEVDAVFVDSDIDIGDIL